MEEQKTAAATRPVLSEKQAEEVRDILAGLSPAGCAHDPEQFEEKARLVMLASDLLMKAAIIHRGEQVPWASMCWSTCLPAASGEMVKTAEIIQRMIGVLCVDVKLPRYIKRGGGLPNFVPAEILPA
jgi:hypothetical protein